MQTALIVLLYAPRRMARTVRIARRLALHTKLRRIFVVINGSRISTKDACRAFAFHSGLDIVEHDNSGQEFGGYQAAINRMASDPPERLIVMNDTVGSHCALSSAYMAAFLRQLSRPMDGFILGATDWSPRVLKLRGLHSPRWIRTHFFAIDRSAMKILGNRLYQPELDELINTSPDLGIFFGEEVSGALRSHIQHWLFSPSGTNWYKAAPLDQENCSTMAAKARSIIQEKYLAMKLEAADVPIIEVYLRRGERVRDLVEKLVFLFTRKLRQL